MTPPSAAQVPGSMLQCQVLRCQRRADRSFVVEDDNWGMAEVAVCHDHGTVLDAGRSYTYNHEDNVIYMDQDLRPPGTGPGT